MFRLQKSSSLRSIRSSKRSPFRRRKDQVPEASQASLRADNTKVRNGTCVFHVKYLGCVKVSESRGMQACEQAAIVLRVS